MSRPELLLITPHYGRAAGGVGVSAERIVTGLREVANLSVLVPDRDLPLETFSEERNLGLSLVRFSAPTDERLQLQFVSDLVSHRIRSVRPSKVLGFYAGGLSYAACIAAERAGIPFATFCRGNDIDLDLFGPEAFRVQYLLTRSQCVFAVSREMQTAISAFAPQAAVSYVANGVDSQAFPPARGTTAPDVPRVGLFGEIKEKKGLGLLLAAFPFEQAQLRIVGSIRPELQKLLHGHYLLNPELLTRIEQRAYLKQVAELVSEFEGVDVVVIPSTHEGMPNVLLEAMSCEKMVVCSAVGGALDVVRNGENGFLFESRSVEGLRAALLQTLQLPAATRERIQQAARETVAQRFSWRAEQRSYLKLLELESSLVGVFLNAAQRTDD